MASNEVSIEFEFRAKKNVNETGLWYIDSMQIASGLTISQS